MKDKNNSKEISLKELVLTIQEWFQYIFSKWYILSVAGLLGAILSYLYAQNQKTLYTATTTFVLETGDAGTGGMSQMAGLAALAGVDLGQSGGGIFQGDNLFELYKSRKMIESTLLLPSISDNSILLLDRYLSMIDVRKDWKEKNPSLLQINFAKSEPSNLLRARDSILQEIVLDINKYNLEVGKLDKKSGIIKVDVKSTDELFSKEFNEALVGQVNDFFVKTKTKKSLNNISILQDKTDSVRAVMNGNITTGAAAIDATPNLNPTRQAQRLVPTQRSQFSAETNKAILGQLVQNLEMSKMALMKDAPLIQKIDEPIYPLKESKVSKIIYVFIGSVLSMLLVTVILVIGRGYKRILKSS